MLSRSGRTSPDGKLTRRLDVPVSEELEEAVIALATVAAVPKAELVRFLLERAIWGEMSMLRSVNDPLAWSRLDVAPRNDR
jgi:hypothetical protein